MPRPAEVNPSNFRVEQIVYETEVFSIASGIWEDGRSHLAMRWNGEGENIGYPKLFNNPVWFIIPRELAIPILKSILHESGSDNNLIVQALNNYNN